MLKNLSQKGFIAFPILFGIVAAIVILASAAVSATLQDSSGRPLEYLCKIRPDAAACKIKERCPELVSEGTRQCPRPTLEPSPSASPEPTISPTSSPTPTVKPTPQVNLLPFRTVLLVPQDQTVSQQYKDGINFNMKKAQEFFASQLNGKTFSLKDNLLELRSQQPLYWFYNCQTQQDCPIKDDNWHQANEGVLWDKVVEDLRSFGLPVLRNYTLYTAFLLPGTHEYGTGCGFNLGPGCQGKTGLAILGDWKTAYAAGFDPPTDPDPSRCHQQGSLCAQNPALGSFIHEIGHALGLPHPENPSDQDISIMWSWWKYPNVGLTQTEKDQLLKNPAIR